VVSIASIFGYSNPLAYAIDSSQNQRDRNKVGFENEAGNRNTGPDTVTISNNALEMLNAANGAGKKPTKLDSAGLLAFLKSDTFAKEAMSYAKAVATKHATDSGDEEDEASDILSEALDSAKGGSKKGVAVVNGKHSSKEELYAEITKVQQEIQELTEVYQSILSLDIDHAQKQHLITPVSERLEEKFEELQGLKAQVKMLEDKEWTMKAAAKAK
jgi:hypothetical protein